MNENARKPTFSPDAGESLDAKSPTLADLLYYNGPDPTQRRELEEFRIAYEAEFGETDLTKRYTSLWPSDQQEWLLRTCPKRYYDGLPPFVQAFLKEKMHMAKRLGQMDDMPGSYLQLYLSGQMDLGSSGYSR
jgi:hypothetical protein